MHRLWQQIAYVDATMAAWKAYGRTLAQRCDPVAYANNPGYRAQCDQPVQLESAQVSNFLVQLHAYRASITGGGGGSVPTPNRCGRDPNDPMGDVICR